MVKQDADFQEVDTKIWRQHCTMQLSITIREWKSFLNSKPCYAFNSDPKRLKLFLNDANPSKLCSKYFVCQISQIFLDLFAKNMKGWSGNSEIWHVEQ